MFYVFTSTTFGHKNNTMMFSPRIQHFIIVIVLLYQRIAEAILYIHRHPQGLNQVNVPLKSRSCSPYTFSGSQLKPQHRITTNDDIIGRPSTLPSSKLNAWYGTGMQKKERFFKKIFDPILGLRAGSSLSRSSEAATNLLLGAMNYIRSSKTRCWITMVIAILLETTAASLCKSASETGKLSLFGGALFLYFLCLCAFTTAVSQINISLAYAVWSALGTVVITTVGIFVFGENCSPLKLISILFVILGVVGLNITDEH